MRILYLHQYFNTPRDAGSTRSYEMARRLVAAGHEVNMVTSRRDLVGSRPGKGWEVTDVDGIRVHWLPVPYANKMPYAQRLKAFGRFALGAAAYSASIPSDIVFASSTPLTIAIPAVWAKKRLRAPMVFEVRDLWPELPIAVGAIKGKPQVAAARWLERFAYQNSSAVVALSPGMKDGVARTGYPADRIAVIPNSSDLQLFDVPEEKGKEFRAKYPWLQERPMILYAGALGKINGIGYLVRIASQLERLDPEIRVVVAGEGVEKEIILRGAQELGVLNRNFFMIDRVPKSEVPELFSAATISLSLVIDLPELWPNSANKFFDTLAAGRPIAINHGGWQNELLTETGAGFILPPNNASESAKVLAKAIQDPERLASARVAARRLAEERFDRDKLAAQLEQVLLDAVQSAPVARK